MQPCDGPVPGTTDDPETPTSPVGSPPLFVHATSGISFIPSPLLAPHPPNLLINHPHYSSAFLYLPPPPRLLVLPLPS